jgi:hypothetical protein
MGPADIRRRDATAADAYLPAVIVLIPIAWTSVMAIPRAAEPEMHEQHTVAADVDQPSQVSALLPKARLRRPAVARRCAARRHRSVQRGGAAEAAATPLRDHPCTF